MSLTDEDLQQITKVVTTVVKPRFTAIDARFDSIDAKINKLATKADMDRMESRITASTSLLQRDAFERLDQHEARITRLEQARSN
jgi:hypothetical protein